MAQEFTLINGNAVAKALRAAMKEEVDLMRPVGSASGAGLPTLAVLLVGLRKDSQTYVNMKTKACAEVGVNAAQYDLPAETSEADVVALVQKLNADVNVHGILVQLPLPDHINADRVISTIDPAKDVDGLTTANAGDLMRNGHKAKLVPCTPLGCIALLDYYKFEIAGKNAVVVGRSQLVGKPVTQLLLSRDATVTMCHSKTKNLEEIVRSADIVVAAIGRAGTLKGNWFKAGAIVLDVGTNAVDDATKKAGYKLVGDVEFLAAKEAGNVAAMTPVPGGVGPMTVTMLLRNTITAFNELNAKNL
jgi:5,10-methylene-tetrahydrofolate dehydrogenase/methenyl tetrahydrofolate cyclohydrolase